MRKQFIFFLLALIFIGCNESGKPASEKSSAGVDSPRVAAPDYLPVKFPDWTVELVNKYIQETDNELISLNRKDSVELSSLEDEVKVTDSATYFVFHIGHSFEHNYITDGWVYIDSATRKIYEYDGPAEKLVEWKK
jgi:hypothetical protein